MSVELWAYLAWTVLATTSTVSSVGKPRKPLTGGQAAVVVLLQCSIVVLVLRIGGVL